LAIEVRVHPIPLLKQDNRMVAELGEGGIAPADGAFAAAIARQTEAWALYSLVQTVQIYMDWWSRGFRRPTMTR